MPATGAQERRPTLEIKQRRRGAECEDLDYARCRHRQSAIGTAALRQTTHTEGAKRSMPIRNVGCRSRADVLARAERAEIKRIEVAGSRESTQQRQDRRQCQRIGHGERNDPAADQAMHDLKCRVGAGPRPPAKRTDQAEAG